MSGIKNILIRSLIVLLGIVIGWLEASLVYNVAIHVTPAAYAVILDLILLIFFYIADVLVFAFFLAIFLHLSD